MTKKEELKEQLSISLVQAICARSGYRSHILYNKIIIFDSKTRRKLAWLQTETSTKKPLKDIWLKDIEIKITIDKTAEKVLCEEFLKKLESTDFKIIKPAPRKSI